MSKEQKQCEIVARTHRLSNLLLERVSNECDKSGNPVNNEINSLILDGLRWREAKVTLHLEEQ